MSKQLPSGHDKPDAPRSVSRRKAVTGVVGVVAGVGVAEAVSSPANAARQSATIESGALAPAVVRLTDAATIVVDASLGNDFRVTLGGNRTMGTPANAVSGQQIIFQVTQGAGAPFALTWSTGYEFSADLPQPSLSTTAGKTDLLGFVYSGTRSSWLLAAYVNGFE